MLKIWGRKTSINVQKVLWACAELAVSYERTDAGGPFGGLDTPAFRALNPNGLVPVIEDDGFVLWESNAIVRYLAAKHGLGSLCPAAPTDRADADRWMDWQTSTVAGPHGTAFVGLVRTPPERRDNAAIDAALAAWGRAMTLLDRHLADRTHLCGEQLTMAEIPLGPVAYRWFAMDIPRPELPALRRWHDRLAERPAFREHVMLPLS